jgi:hypothetical protein
MFKATTAIMAVFAIFFQYHRAAAYELSGIVTGECTLFPNRALFPGQKDQDASISFEAEYYSEWNERVSFIFVPFLRLDAVDDERTHFDIRELNVLIKTDLMDMRIGYGKVFWGVTEFYHLVDIINQTDLIESIDAEEKLGQPMVQFSISTEYGLLDGFVLPFFIERTFPGKSGRLRSPIEVDTDRAVYESDKKRHHIDFAVRYSHTIGNCDFGIYHFRGTSREPTLIFSFDENRVPFLYPYYPQIGQTGLDAQWVAGQWLLKLEAIYRTSREKDYFASVSGFEYTVVNVSGSGVDLGLIGEWAYDDRGGSATTLFQDDLMCGVRLSLNDMASTTILAGLIWDLQNNSKGVNIEANRRIGERWKATVELWAFMSQPPDDTFYSLRNDDYLRFEMAYYF